MYNRLPAEVKHIFGQHSPLQLYEAVFLQDNSTKHIAVMYKNNPAKEVHLLATHGSDECITDAFNNPIPKIVSMYNEGKGAVDTFTEDYYRHMRSTKNDNYRKAMAFFFCKLVMIASWRMWMLVTNRNRPQRKYALQAISSQLKQLKRNGD